MTGQGEAEGGTPAASSESAAGADQATGTASGGGRSGRGRGARGGGGDDRSGGERSGGGPRGGSGGRSSEDGIDRREAEARAEERWSLGERPMGLPAELDPPPRVVDLDWERHPVPAKVEREVSGSVVRRGEFGWLSDVRVDEIADVVRDTAMTLEQALSLRVALLQQKAVRTHALIQRRADELRRRYDGGEGLIALSRDVDAPPMNIFRAILGARGWSKASIRDNLREPDARLAERDAREFHAAEEADRVSNVDQSETQDRAEAFERLLQAHFDAHGVRYRPQEELVAEQQAAHGRSVRTPDLLLLDLVRINGEPVAWLDAKHFYGADVAFQRRKTAKQVARYASVWGQGAIIYRHGYCDALDIPGAVLLDASVLDVERLTNGGL